MLAPKRGGTIRTPPPFFSKSVALQNVKLQRHFHLRLMFSRLAFKAIISSIITVDNMMAEFHDSARKHHYTSFTSENDFFFFFPFIFAWMLRKSTWWVRCFN
ncbi:hypothetical protein NC651_016438 [Populus alba x Populus x berolinensis]|nr:hypothetical protein NC651_016438 [Populus alba x Populus x berolinensis]